MESRIQSAWIAISIGSASSHSSRSNHVLGLDHPLWLEPASWVCDQRRHWGLILCNCYLEILSSLVFACVLYNSSLMEQWNLCQGLGAWVWVGDSCLSPPSCVLGPKLSHQLPSLSLFVGPQRGLGSGCVGKVRIGHEPLAPSCGSGLWGLYSPKRVQH